MVNQSVKSPRCVYATWSVLSTQQTQLKSCFKKNRINTCDRARITKPRATSRESSTPRVCVRLIGPFFQKERHLAELLAKALMSFAPHQRDFLGRDSRFTIHDPRLMVAVDRYMDFAVFVIHSD